MRRWSAWVGAVVLAAPLFLVHAAASPVSSTQIDSEEAGRIVFLRECASCHGEAATGWGPMARLLRQPPPDLTRLSTRTIPFDRASVRAGVSGRIRLEPPQGESQMPHWRSRLDSPVATSGGAVTEMDAVLTYLESIQREKFGAAPGPSLEMLAQAGKPLFAVHCAGCHGPDGRGISATQYTVGVAPPDLTAIALRNQGEVNMRLLYEQIARSPDGSGMPSWEHAFVRAGWPRALSMKNIEAIAWYVESLQRR